MSISFAFKLDLSAVFFCELFLSVLRHVAVQHTIVWHICFRNKYTLTQLYLSTMTIYNLSDWIWSNFLNSLAYFILFIIPVSATVAGLVGVRFSSYCRSFAKTSDITDWLCSRNCSRACLAGASWFLHRI